jgi:protein SCO1/2
VSAGGAAVRRGWPQAGSVALIVLLAAVATIPLGALWGAFGPGAHVAPDFTVIDQDGRPFTLSATRKHPAVLFFGYTRCPDECPLTLAHLAQALRVPGVPADVGVFFITVDPVHDTPAVLKPYVRSFDPRFTGLTADLKTLEPVYAAYHVPREAEQAKAGEAPELFAHGTTLYFIGRGGRLKGLGNWNDPPAAIAQELRDYE